jgi:hypothetical protein
MHENGSGFSGRKRYACFHLVDLKNINNMNEAFERQFCSGCLGPQITTKIGFTDKKCCSNTLISSIATYFTMQTINIDYFSGKQNRAKNFLLICRLIASIKCDIQTKNTNTSSFFTKPRNLIST